MSEVSVIEIKQEIEECEQRIKRSAAVKVLEGVQEFKDIIVDDYHSEEVIRLVTALAKTNEAGRTELFNRLLGISYSMEHLHMAHTVAEVAAGHLSDLNELLHEITVNGE